MAKATNAVFANEIQQLLVTISRHLYIARGGVLKYQEKPAEIDAMNFHRFKKEYLAYYVLRDLFSGNFIFAVATTKKMIPLLDFLHFAWKKNKAENHFWGLPHKLSVPRRISSPELLCGLQLLGVEPFHPSSGFTSGIRIIKSIEDNICHFVLRLSAIHSLHTTQWCKSRIYGYVLEDSEKDSRIELWRNNLPPGHPQAVPEYALFKDFFSTPEKDRAVPLLGISAEGNAVEVMPRQLDFLDSPIESKKFSPEKLVQAQELLYAAYDARYVDTMLHKTYQALNCSPYCTDAYNLMAQNSEYLDEKIALYRRSVRAGELSLGELFFKRNEGRFWGIFETRPYMRALHGLAIALWKKGYRKETLEIYQKMLRLNHSDNQGIRYLLGFRLLEEKRYGEIEKLHQVFEEETCFMLYNLALSRFCNKVANANNVLFRALQANEHVPTFLLGKREVPYRLPDSYSRGSIEEAAIYAGETASAWHKADGALDWLRENCSTSKRTNPIRTAEPNIVQVLQDFLEEEAVRLGKQTFRKYENAIELLQISLNNYGHQHLLQTESATLERYLKAGGDEKERSFCHLFGPDKIPGAVGEFLGYFMVRKFSCGKDQLRATGTTLKRLAGWLADRGHISSDKAKEMAAIAAQGYRELPVANELSEALFDYVENAPSVQGGEEIEDLFTVVRVEPGRVHLQAGSEEPLVVEVPQKISNLCRKGWMLNLLLIKTKHGWRIAQTSRVYPLL